MVPKQRVLELLPEEELQDFSGNDNKYMYRFSHKNSDGSVCSYLYCSALNPQELKTRFENPQNYEGVLGCIPDVFKRKSKCCACNLGELSNPVVNKTIVCSIVASRGEVNQEWANPFYISPPKL